MLFLHRMWPLSTVVMGGGSRAEKTRSWKVVLEESRMSLLSDSQGFTCH